MNNLEWLYRNDYEIMGYIDSHVVGRCYGGVPTLGESRGWLLSPCEWEDGNTPESHGEATSDPQTAEPEPEPASAENEPQDASYALGQWIGEQVCKPKQVVDKQVKQASEVAGNAESYNLGGVSGGEIIGNGESYKQIDSGTVEAEGSQVPELDADGTCPNGIGQASTDTREKLEDEISEWCASSNAVFARSRFNRIIEWLNRQAAITERELCKQCEWPNLAAQPDQEAYDRIAELTAERDEWQRTAEDYQERKDELTAERDRLRDELAECDENRIEFKEQRDYFQKVVQIQAESFRKLEARLVEFRTAEVGDMRDRMEMLEAENRELNMRLHGTPF